MLELKTQTKVTKHKKSNKQPSVIVECPSCKAIITVKNAHISSSRFCWRCLKNYSISG